MKKFIVTIREVHTQMVEVYAENADMAKQKVSDGSGKYLENTLEYSDTLSPDTWTAEEI